MEFFWRPFYLSLIHFFFGIWTKSRKRIETKNKIRKQPQSEQNLCTKVPLNWTTKRLVRADCCGAVWSLWLMELSLLSSQFHALSFLLKSKKINTIQNMLNSIRNINSYINQCLLVLFLRTRTSIRSNLRQAKKER